MWDADDRRDGGVKPRASNSAAARVKSSARTPSVIGKGMRRKASIVAVVLSLVACAASLSVWVISHRRCDVFWVYRLGPHLSGRGTGEVGLYDDNTWSLKVSRGAVAIGYFDHRLSPRPAVRAYAGSQQGWHHAASKPYDLYDWINYPAVQALGFKYGLCVYKLGTFTFGRELIVPLWVLVLVFAAPPIGLVARRFVTLPQQRREAGCCPRCGYDLRATPRRCPECGSVNAAPELPSGSSAGLEDLSS